MGCHCSTICAKRETLKVKQEELKLWQKDEKTLADMLKEIKKCEQESETANRDSKIGSSKAPTTYEPNNTEAVIETFGDFGQEMEGNIGTLMGNHGAKSAEVAENIKRLMAEIQALTAEINSLSADDREYHRRRDED